MNDRGIIFSAQMVRALLEGRKTMTRRLATSPLAKCKPGDRLWVREAFAMEGAMIGPGRDAPAFMADFPGDPRGLGWRSPIHMPRRASRLTLIVTATKIERVQEISREDELAEGTPKGTFFDSVWSALHGDASWQANPEVVALTFTVERRNIDAVTAAPAA
jgi:hypothetical protein